MSAKGVARGLFAAAAGTAYAGLSLYVGRGSRSLSPFSPMPTVGTLVMLFAGVVLLPAAIVAYAVARRARWLGQRLGVLPPSDGLPDEDLGAGVPRDEPR